MHIIKCPSYMRYMLASMAMVVAYPAFAQTSEQPVTVSPTDTSTASATEVHSDDQWHYSLGLGLFEMPKYPGASATRVQPAPLVGVSYGRYFFGSVPDANVPFGFGAFLYRDDHVHVGLALSYDMIKPRKASDDDHLQGLSDIDRTAHATLFANYNLDWFSVVGALSQDVAGKHEGATLSLDFLGKYSPINKLTLTGGPGLTWGSASYNQTFYGVSAADSTRSGLSTYTPGAGIAALRLTTAATYALDRHWSAGGRIVASKLPGTVGSSPIVEKKTQMMFGAFANYVF